MLAGAGRLQHGGPIAWVDGNAGRGCFGSRAFSGEGGIRTHGDPTGHNGFRDRPIQPLWHLSAGDYTKGISDPLESRCDTPSEPRSKTPLSLEKGID